MGRKSTARVEEPKAPTTVAERRRAFREEKAGPGIAKVVIDLSKPDARKQLVAIYPRPENDVYIDATPELEAAAFKYVEERDAESLAKKKKETAGNALCNAIGKNLGIRGKGWKAEWDMSNGSVDWGQLAKDLAIPDETIAKYRKPQVRGLDVKEVASDEG